MSAKAKLVIIEGSETYSRLGTLTVEAYEDVLQTRPALNDGLGNCWVVAAAAHGAAQFLGIKSRLCGGRVRDPDKGEFLFGGGYHYWCALSDGTIIDSPTPAAVAVHNPKLEDMDYVELKGQARHLRKLADDARIRLERLAAAKMIER